MPQDSRRKYLEPQTSSCCIDGRNIRVSSPALFGSRDLSHLVQAHFVSPVQVILRLDASNPATMQSVRNARHGERFTRARALRHTTCANPTSAVRPASQEHIRYYRCHPYLTRRVVLSRVACFICVRQGNGCDVMI